MGSKHEAIVIKVISDWSVNRRGRLYKMMQGTFRGMYSDAVIRISPYPGKRTKGFPDIFGFEFMTYQKYENWQYKEIKVPVFCAIEVKTKAYSKLSRGQIDFLNYIKISGGKSYVAMEDNSPCGYSLTEWVVK